jgi:hypothetical protein
MRNEVRTAGTVKNTVFWEEHTASFKFELDLKMEAIVSSET